MRVVILLIGILLFSAYFYAIGSGFLAFLPFVVFLILAIIIVSHYKEKFDISQIDNKYLFLGVWGVVNIAIVVLCYLLGVGMIESLLGILGLNILTLLTSYAVKLMYATDISYIMYNMIGIAIIIYTLFTPGVSTFMTLEYILLFSTAFLAFLYFVVPLYYTIAGYIKIHFFLSILASVGVVIYDQINNIYYATLLLLVIMTAILYGVYYILSHMRKTPESRILSVRKILDGERILPILERQKSYKKTYGFFEQLVSDLPQYAKYFLEGSNIMLLGVALYTYLSRTENFLYQIDWIYWAIIIIFLANIYILKTIHYTSILQKIGMFLGINIFVYIVGFSLISEWSNTLLVYTIGWNILYSIIIFNLDSIFPVLVWTKLDYFTALGVDAVVVVANIILMTYLQISGEIIFALAFLYLAIKMLIMLYTLNKIRT